MDDTRAHQPIVTGQPPHQPAYPPPPPPYPYAAPPTPSARPGTMSVFGRTLRLILRRTLYVLTIIGRALKPFALPIVIFLIMGAVIGWMAFQLWWPKTAGTQQVVDPRVAVVLPAESVEGYIRGQKTYNADQMWSSFSSQYQESQLQQGASKETLQVRVNTERSQGLKYVNYDYIGGVKLDSGGMYFYSVDLEYQGQRGSLPLIITVDKDGKIIRVNWPPSEN